MTAFGPAARRAGRFWGLVLALLLLGSACERVVVDPRELDLEEPYIPVLTFTPSP